MTGTTTLTPKEYAAKRRVSVQTVSEALRDCAVPHKRLPGVLSVKKTSRFYLLGVDLGKVRAGRANKSKNKK